MTQQNIDFDLSQFGYVEEKRGYAPAGSWWRDKEQGLWIADGQGVFTNAEDEKKVKGEGWTGDNPGHGLVRVECKNHKESHNAAPHLLCEAAFREDMPPGELEIAELVNAFRKKGQLAADFERALEAAGCTVESLDTTGWPRRVAAFTWAAYERVKNEITQLRLIQPRDRYKLREESFLTEEEDAQRIEGLAKQTEDEQEQWLNQEDEQDHRQQESGNVQTVDFTVSDSDGWTATNSNAQVATTRSDITNRPTPIEVEVMSDLPAHVINDDGEVDLDKYFELAGINRGFRVTDKESAEWVIGRIRGIQHRIDEAAVQVVRMISTGLNAVSGLTEYYSTELRDWAEPQLGKHASDSKPGAKSKHKKGDYKVKNLRTLAGALFFKKRGGAKNVTPNETKEWCRTLTGEQRVRYQVKEELTFTIPPGYEIYVYEKGCDDSIDSEDYAVHGISLKRDFKYSRTTLGGIVESGESIPGFVDHPHDPLGTVTIGGDKAWSWNTTQKNMKKAVNLLTLRGEEAADDSEEDSE